MLSKPLVIALLVSLSLNGLFGYLSYSFYGDKSKAEQSLVVALEANKSLESSMSKKEQACKITDQMNSEYQKEKAGIVGKKGQDLLDLSKMMQSPSPEKKEKNAAKIPVNNGDVNEESNVASLDSRLPPNVVSLLSKSCQRVRGEACPHPQ